MFLLSPDQWQRLEARESEQFRARLRAFFNEHCADYMGQAEREDALRQALSLADYLHAQTEAQIAKVAIIVLALRVPEPGQPGVDVVRARLAQTRKSLNLRLDEVADMLGLN